MSSEEDFMKHWKACYVSLRIRETNGVWIPSLTMVFGLFILFVACLNSLINNGDILLSLILTFVTGTALCIIIADNILEFQLRRSLRREFRSFATYYEEIQDAIEDDLSDKQFQLFLHQIVTICACDDRVRCVLNKQKFIDKEFDVIVNAKKHGISCRKIR